MRISTAQTRLGFLAILMSFISFSAFSQVIPPNDDCADAIKLYVGDVDFGTTLNATTDNAPSCGGVSVQAPGVWYVIQGHGDSITAEMCTFGATYDARISVYTGSCGNFTCVAADDNGCGPVDEPTVSWQSVACETYYILVHGTNGETGDYIINISSPTLSTVSDPVTSDDEICLDETATLSGTASYADPAFEPLTYNWAPSADLSSATSATTTFSPSAPGTYVFTLTVTDQQGCTDENTVTVLVNDLPVVSTTDLDPEYCLNDPVSTIFGSPVGGTYSGPGISTRNGVDVTVTPQTITETATSTPTSIPANFPASNGGFSGDTTKASITISGATGLVGSGSSVIESVDLRIAHTWNMDLDVTLVAPDGARMTLWTDVGGTSDGFDVSIDDNASTQIQSASTFGFPYAINGSYLAEFGDLLNTELAGSPLNGTWTIEIYDDFSVFSGQLESFSMTVGWNDSTFTPFTAGDFDPSAAGAGSHVITYTYTDSNGCTNTATTSTIVNPLPVVSFSGLASPYCLDDAPATLTGSPAGGTFSGPGVSDLGGGTGEFNPILAGAGTHDITYTYTDANGCTNSSTQSVLVHPLPVVSFTGLNASPYCVSDGNDTLTGSPVGGTFSGDGVTDLGGGQGIFNPLSLGLVGEYWVYYTYTDANGCTNVDSQSVTLISTGNDLCENAIPVRVGDVVSGTTECSTIDVAPFCVVPIDAPGVWYTVEGTGGTITLDLCNIPGTTYDTRINVYSGDCNNLTCVAGNDDGAACGFAYPSTVTFNSSACETYYILIQGFNNLTGDFVMSVSGSLNNITADAGADQEICIDETVVLGGSPTASGGNPGYTYSWAPASDLSSATAANPTFTPSAAGTFTYIVTVTDATGCVDEDTMEVVVNPLPVVAINGLDPAYCVDDEFAIITGSPAGGTFTATAGLIPVGYGGTAYSQSLLATPQTIPDNDPVGISISQTVSVPGSNLGTDISLVSVDLVVDHNYLGDIFIEIENPAGNTITLFNRPTSGAGNCFWDDINASFVWGTSNPADAVCQFGFPSVSGDVNASAGFDVSDLNDGTNPNGAWEVTVRDLDAGVTGSVLGVTLNFEGQGVAFDPATAGVGTHTVTYTYTDGNGCTASVDQDVTVNPLPVVSFTGLEPFYCFSDAIDTLSGSPAGGFFAGPGIDAVSSGTASQCSYTLNMFDSFGDGWNGASLDVFLNGNFVGNYTVSPAQGSANTETFLVEDGDVIELFYNSGAWDSEVTFDLVDPNGTIVHSDGTNPTIGLNYTGTSTTSGCGLIYRFDASAAGAGEHTIYYTYVDANGCSNIDSQTTIVNPEIVVDAGADATICANETIELGGAAPSGGSGPLNINWSPSTNLSADTIANPIFDPALVAGTYTYTLTVSDSVNCVVEDVVEIFVDTLPQVTLTGLQPGYCVDAECDTLFAVVIDGGDTTIISLGSPLGGTFSGPGVVIPSANSGGGGGGPAVPAPCDYEISLSWPGFGDEISWTFRDNNGTVLLSGGPYGFGGTDFQTVTSANPPHTFFIETQGTFNDNTVNYSITSNGNTLASGFVPGGSSATETGLDGGCTTNSISGLPEATSTVNYPTCAVEYNESQTNFVTAIGQTQNFSFTGATVPPAGTAGVLNWTAEMDLSFPTTEFYNVFDENGNFIFLIAPGGSDCSIQTGDYSISDAQLQAWTADGVVNFTAIPGSGINPLCSGEDSIQFNLVYCLEEGPACIEEYRASQTESYNVTGPTLNYSFTNTPDPAANVLGTIDFVAEADINSSFEFFELFDENNNLIGQIQGGGQCQSFTGSFTVANATLAQWTADGVVNFRAEASNGVNAICAGDFLTLELSYCSELEGGGETIFFCPDSAGVGVHDIVYTYEGLNGCINTDTFTVEVFDLPTVEAEADTMVCRYFDVPLSAQASGTLAPYTYNWLPALDFKFISANGDSIVATPDSSTQFTVIATDANGCTNFDTVDVIINQLPDITLDIYEGADSACYNETVCIFANVASYEEGALLPELMYFKFDQSGSNNVPNEASSPVGNNPAQILGSFNQTGTGMSGSMLQYPFSGGANSAFEYVNTNWPTNMPSEWSIGFWMENAPNNLNEWALFGDADAQIVATLSSPGGFGTPRVVDLRIAGVGSVEVGGFGFGANYFHFVYSESDGTVKGYLNGSLENTVNIITPVAITSTGPFKIGGAGNLDGMSAGLKLDEFRMYDRALTDQQVLLTYNYTQLSNEPTGLTYTWNTNGNTVNYTGQYNDSICITATNSGYIVLEVIDSFGCIGYDSIYIDVNPEIVVDAGVDIDLCQGSTAVLGGAPTAVGGTGNLTYSWAPAERLDDPTLANPTTNTIVSTIYTVEVTDEAGCVVTDEVEVTSREVPMANAGNDISICLTDSAMIGGMPAATMGTGPYTYSWSPVDGLSDPTAANPMASPDTTTNYVLTVTDIYGCSDDSLMRLEVYPLPPVTIDPVADLCLNDAPINLTAASMGGTWSGNGIVDPATGLFDPAVAGAGTHTVMYENMSFFGCIDSATFDVVVNDLPNVEITSPTGICYDQGPTVLTANVVGGTWSGNGIVDAAAGIFDPMIAGLGGHMIVLEFTDLNGCTNTDTAMFVVEMAPDATIDPVAELCSSDDAITLTAATAGGTWSGPGITNATAGTFNPGVAGAGVHTVFYSVTGPNGCVATDSIDITVDGLTNFGINAAGPFCEEASSVILTATVAGGYWSGPGVVNPLIGEFNPTVAGAGVHTVVYTITNQDGCISIDSAQIVVNATPDATISLAGPFCANDVPATLTAATAGGTWSGAGITNASAGTFDPAVAGPGTHTITYEVTDANGCFGSATTVIKVNELPVISGTVTDVICPGDVNGKIDVSVEGGAPPYDFAWSNGANTLDIDEVAAGTYTLTVTDAKGCTETATFTVGTQSTPITASAVITNATAPVYDNGAIDITVSGGTAPYFFEWSNGATTEDISGLRPDSFRVTITDFLGCSYDFVFEVQADFGLTVDLDDLSRNIELYPNPTSDVINVNIEMNGLTENLDLTVFDVLGRKVYERADVISNVYNHAIDMSDMASGQYMIRFKIGDEFVTKKFVLTK